MTEATCGYDHSPKGRALLVHFGPSLKVNFGFDPDFVAGFGRAPKPDITGLDALIDTGAEECYIDRPLADTLDLPLINQDTVGSALSSGLVNIHLAQIHIIALGTLIHGRFAAVNLRENGIKSDVLLGRTFLENYIFHYDGPTGKATIRRPSAVANNPSTDD